ncbi:MAG: hypothetical protein JSU68_04925 [Phycisphaerales bacterium]|nr:MAG: hypothetical protein JSU68_04925 [Phycisphaerales bacterium]
MSNRHVKSAGGRADGDFGPAQVKVRAGAKAGGLAALLAAGAIAVGASIGLAGWGWLCWVGLLPVFLAIRIVRPGAAMMAGGLWGGSLFVTLAFLGDGIPLTLRSLGLMVVIPALYCGSGVCVTRRVGFNPLVLGLGWVGVELALGWLGLCRGLLTGAGSQGPVIAVAGRVLGYACAAFLIAYLNALLVSLAADLRLTGSEPREVAAGDDGRALGLLDDSAWCPIPIICSMQPRAPPRVAHR